MSLSQELLKNKKYRFKIIKTMHNQNEENFKTFEQKKKLKIGKHASG